MKKLLLLLCAVVLSATGAWADDGGVTVTWESYPGWVRNNVADVHWVGITTPGTNSDTYKMSKFQFCQETGGNQADCYTAISTTGPTGGGYTLAKSDVLGISSNHLIATKGNPGEYYTYTLEEPIELTGGTTYYMVFISSNQVNEDNKYNVKKNRVSLNTSYGTYAPKLLDGNNTQQDWWTPGFKATLTTDVVYTVDYTCYSTEDNSEIASGTKDDVVGSFAAPDVEGYVCSYATTEDGTTVSLPYAVTEDVTLKFYYKPILTALSNASSAKSYTLITDRGFVYAASADATQISFQKGTAPTASNTLHQWVFVPYNDNLYLYNVGAGKFATYKSDNDNNALVQYIAKPVSDAGLTNSYKQYPVTIKITVDENTSYYFNTNDNQGAFFSTWKTVDEGNTWQIVEAADFSSEALAAAQAKLQTWDELTTNYNKLVAYDYGENLGQYTLGGVLAMAGQTATGVLNRLGTIIESQSESDFADALVTSKQAIEGTKINQPTSKFVHFKNTSVSGYSYMGTAASGKAPLVTSVDKAGIYYITSDSKIVSYDQAKYLSKDAGAQCTLTNEATFTIGDGGNGTYTFYYAELGYLIAWTSGETDRLKDESNYDNWTLEEVTSLPVAISKYGMKTFSAPVALTIPTGVQAFTASVDGTKVTLEEVTGTIPANSAVILYSGDYDENGESQTFNFTIDASNTDDAKTSALTPLVASKAKDDNSLTLQYDLDNGKFGFWKAAGTYLKGFSAYLEWNESMSSIRSFQVVLPTTGITTTIDNPAYTGGETYDLQGRRVEKASKGLYIVGGKKVLF